MWNNLPSNTNRSRTSIEDRRHLLRYSPILKNYTIDCLIKVRNELVYRHAGGRFNIRHAPKKIIVQIIGAAVIYVTPKKGRKKIRGWLNIRHAQKSSELWPRGWLNIRHAPQARGISVRAKCPFANVVWIQSERMKNNAKGWAVWIQKPTWKPCVCNQLLCVSGKCLLILSPTYCHKNFVNNGPSLTPFVPIFGKIFTTSKSSLNLDTVTTDLFIERKHKPTAACMLMSVWSSSLIENSKFYAVQTLCSNALSGEIENYKGPPQCTSRRKKWYRWKMGSTLYTVTPKKNGCPDPWGRFYIPSRKKPINNYFWPEDFS